MKTKTYVFSVTLKGTGDNPDAAWQDAVEAFSTDSGVTPDAYEEEEDEDSDDEEDN
jgi:hypothetical protein